MGTRLLSEQIIKEHHPHLKYIRIHTNGKNSAVIYAWNEELQLPPKDIAALRQFAAGYLSPQVCFQVKAYHMIQNDQVPQVSELPESIQQAAMCRTLNQDKIVSVINSLFSGGHVAFDKYDVHTGTIYFAAHLNTTVTDIEKQLVHQLIYEIIPVGFKYEITYV